MASISAEEASRLKPFMGLIEKLGTFAGQIADEGLEAVEIEYEGEVAQLNTQPLTAMALASLMRPLDAGREHGVGAGVLKQKGTPLTESKRETLADLWIADPDQGAHRVGAGGAWRAW